jgi:hypothetical protein
MVKSLDASKTLDRIQKRFEKVHSLIERAADVKNVQQVRNYLDQLKALLEECEPLRSRFIMGAGLNLSYYIDDDIRDYKAQLKSWEAQ